MMKQLSFDLNSIFMYWLYWVHQKRQHLMFMNIRFVLQKKRRLADFGPWDLRTIVIVFYRLNYLNKLGCVNQLWIEIYNSEYSSILRVAFFWYTLCNTGWVKSPDIFEMKSSRTALHCTVSHWYKTYQTTTLLIYQKENRIPCGSKNAF